MSYPQQPQPGNWSDPSWPPPQQPYGGDPAANPPSYPAGTPGYQAYPEYQSMPASPAGYPGYPAYGYQSPVTPAQRTNGLAIASMVISIVAAMGLVCYGFGGFLGIVGAIMGHIARRQARERAESGEGMAMAGVIVGWIATALAVLIVAVIVFFVWAAVTTGSTSNYNPTPAAT